MSNLFILTGLRLRSLWSLNKFKYTSDRRAKKRYKLMTGVFVFLIVAIASYVSGFVYLLCSMGAADSVPSLLVFLSGAIVVIIGIFGAGERILGREGYSILISMPLPPRVLVISRFAALYVEDLAYAAAIFLPGAVTYALTQKPDLLFYPVALLSLLLIPIIPLVISVTLGSLIMAVSSHVRHKSLIQSLLGVALVITVLIGSFSMQSLPEDFAPERLTAFIASASTLFTDIYPVAGWLGDGMLTLEYAGLLFAFVVSLVAAAVCLVLISVFYKNIMDRLGRVRATHSYKLARSAGRSPLRALYVREAKRYFSSSIYVTNTIVGPVLATIMSVALLIAGIDNIASLVPPNIPLEALVPIAVSAVFSMMTTTSVSISMEGRAFGGVLSLPITAKALFDSKILLQLSLIAPFYLVSQIALAIALRPDLLQLLATVLLPLSFIAFSSVIGIAVNIRLHSFDWEREEQVVKQSASAMLGGFAGLLLALPLIGAVILLPDGLRTPVTLGASAVILLSAFAVYRKNNRIRLNSL